MFVEHQTIVKSIKRHNPRSLRQSRREWGQSGLKSFSYNTLMSYEHKKTQYE